jgi:glycosyltransferase involved in cell wall biosynthesis
MCANTTLSRSLYLISSQLLPDMKRVCFFGIYNPQYARSRILIQGFKENGYEVVECRVDPMAYPGIAKYIKLIRTYRALSNKTFDTMLVAFPGHTVVWLARLLHGPHVMFDAFVSLYDSNVLDRRVHAPYSIRAGFDWLWDWMSMTLAEIVVFDTDQHIEYAVATYHQPRAKFIRVPVGTDTSVFYPREESLPDMFTVHFHGTFIPLQGISYILDAARLLQNEPIAFNILGDGQEFKTMHERVFSEGLTHVHLIPTVPYEELPLYIARAHACLGIFGATAKAGRVVPNKVFECLAMGKPVITADTPAIRDAFVEGQEILLCKAASGEALAEAIRQLIRDEALRLMLSRASHEAIERSYTPQKLVQGLVAGMVH